jgi:hypothetical protein
MTTPDQESTTLLVLSGFAILVALVFGVAGGLYGI